MQNREKLFDSLVRTVHANYDLKVVLGHSAVWLRSLAWEKLPDDNWATVHHNLSNWIFRANLLGDNKARDYDERMCECALDGAKGFIMCAQYLKKILLEQGQVSLAGAAESASKYALGALRAVSYWA